MAYKHLKDMGKDTAEVGRLVGKSREVISRALDLLELPLEIQESVTRGTLTEGHTRHLRKISDKNKQMGLAKQAAEEGWTVKRTEQEVKERYKSTRASTPTHLSHRERGVAKNRVRLPPLPTL